MHHITNLLRHPLFLTQVFFTIPIKASFLPLFSYLLEKRQVMEQKKETINTNANMQNFWGEEDYFIVVFLMVTRLLLQNNQDFQQVNSFSLDLSSLLKLLCLPLFFIT